MFFFPKWFQLTWSYMLEEGDRIFTENLAKRKKFSNHGSTILYGVGILEPRFKWKYNVYNDKSTMVMISNGKVLLDLRTKLWNYWSFSTIVPCHTILTTYVNQLFSKHNKRLPYVVPPCLIDRASALSVGDCRFLARSYQIYLAWCSVFSVFWMSL